MDLRTVLGMLAHVTGPNASGEYTACCPAHEDKNASLTVRQKTSGKDGKDRIYLSCHAGCHQDAIMAALGITARDLIVNPDPEYTGGRKGSRGKPSAPPPPEAPELVPGATVREAVPIPPPEKPKKPAIDFAHPAKVYSYQDTDGRELFQVCRYEYIDGDGKPDKTFRQRRYAPGEEKANRDGYVMSVPAEIRDNTVYKMPEVARAIREGRPVYVVEGEKDVDTMIRLGFVATCNPGGASAGLWREGHTRALAGADAIILPDCDVQGNKFVGQNHALEVALHLQGVAKRVRLVDIKEACPELPPKGDITDMVELMGDVEAMDALARQVAATRDFDPNAVPFWLTPAEQMERLYAAVQGYGVEHGCIVQKAAEGSKALCDFAVIPREELIQDDGISQSLSFVLDGWSSSGRRLGRVTVNAGDLDSMSWVTEKWGFDASLAPGSTTKSKAAWAIKKVGQMTAKKVTQYTHTGWRRIGGKLVYLYHGGAVGMEGVTVDMGDALKSYRLDGGGGEAFRKIPFPEAARVSLRLQKIMREDIGIALLGVSYLAPLREFLIQTDVVPAFALFLYGESGTHKSTAATLALSHFGNFHAKNAPASFSDTANQIRRKAFYIKDMPLLVDDFHPTSSMVEKRQMAATAQSLSRAFGDGVDRGRLNSDRSLSASTPPRSVAIITGEDLPAIGASGLARFFIIDIDKGDIPVGADMTEMQDLARKGMLQRAMRGYILWLQKQAEEMPERLHGLFVKYREMVRERSTGQHDRAPEAVACILIGYAMMLNYFRDLGVIDGEEAGGMLEHGMLSLLEASQKQARDMEAEKPTQIFLRDIGELLTSKQAAVVDLTLEEHRDPPPTVRMIGYVDSAWYYLIPEVAFGLVQRLCREQGQEFPVSLRALYKHLRTDGVIPRSGEGGTKIKRVTVDGKSRAQRLLWIPVGLIDGPRAEVEQMTLAPDAADPFKT